MSFYATTKNDKHMAESAVDGVISPIFHRYDITAPRRSLKWRRMNSGAIVKHIESQKKDDTKKSGDNKK